MYKSHKVFELPDPATQIWRYLGFTKLVALLSTNALHFTRADQLTDRFEYTLPIPNIEAAKEQYAEALRDHGDDRRAKSESKLTRYDYIRRGRESIDVNCWHVNRAESAAMWKLYDEGGKGVAIRSTLERLITCLDDAPNDIFIGKVKYIDFESDSIPTRNIFYPIIHKRRSFEHEQELRAVLREENIDSAGIGVSVDIQRLIERVFVAPTSEQWYEDLVRSVLAKYEVNAQVERSDLKADPIW